MQIKIYLCIEKEFRNDNRIFLADFGCCLQESFEIFLVVCHIHGGAAQNIRGPDQTGETHCFAELNQTLQSSQFTPSDNFFGWNLNLEIIFIYLGCRIPILSSILENLNRFSALSTDSGLVPRTLAC
jgi:hypothetical protein